MPKTTMSKNVKPVPEGYRTVTPYIVVPGVAKVIDFAKQAFDATERQRHVTPDGRVMHAEIQIGDCIIMLGEPEGQAKPMPATLLLYLNDVDTAYRRALDAGATSVREPADQFYGDRSGGVQDAAGNQWWISTHIEDVSPEELRRRAQAQAR